MGARKAEEGSERGCGGGASRSGGGGPAEAVAAGRVCALAPAPWAAIYDSPARQQQHTVRFEAAGVRNPPEPGTRGEIDVPTVGSTVDFSYTSPRPQASRQTAAAAGGSEPALQYLCWCGEMGKTRKGDGA